MTRAKGEKETRARWIDFLRAFDSFITIIIFINMSIEKKYLLGVGAIVSLAVLAKLYLSSPKHLSRREEEEIKEQELENEKEL